MVMVVSAPSSTFGAMIFGTPSQSSLDYMHTTGNMFTASLNQYAQTFYQNYSDAYRRISYTEDLQLIKAAMRAADNYMLPNRIMHYTSIGELQNAAPIMQSWIMANPVVRELWFSNQLDGYSGSYTNWYGNAVGMDHVEYQAAVNGVYRDVDGMMQCEIYPLCPHEMEIQDQVQILGTWIEIEDYIKRKKEDPTSRFNSFM